MLLRALRSTKAYRFSSFIIEQYRQWQNRMYSAKDFAVFEKGAIVENGVEIYHPNRIVMREYAVIHRGSLINAVGGLHVGKYSGISYNCTIFTSDHAFLKSQALPFDKRDFIKPVYIDDSVMIGANVCIMPGVKVGEGAVIGMGSVLQKDIPPLAIVSGNPAEIIAYRDKENYDTLKSNRAFQCLIVGKYEMVLPLMHKKKYKDFLQNIGFLEL